MERSSSLKPLLNTTVCVFSFVYANEAGDSEPKTQNIYVAL